MYTYITMGLLVITVCNNRESTLSALLTVYIYVYK